MEIKLKFVCGSITDNSLMVMKESINESLSIL